MVQVPKTFVDETLWPEFQKISSELDTYLQDVTDRVVKNVLHEDCSDAVVVEEPLRIETNDASVSDSNQKEAKNNDESSNQQKNKPRSAKNKKKKRKKKKRGG